MASTKKELAKAYEVSQKTKAKWLNSGVLFEKLKLTGYHKFEKVLTNKEVSIVIDHLGVIYKEIDSN